MRVRDGRAEKRKANDHWQGQGYYADALAGGVRETTKRWTEGRQADLTSACGIATTA